MIKRRKLSAFKTWLRWRPTQRPLSFPVPRFRGQIPFNYTLLLHPSLVPRRRPLLAFLLRVLRLQPPRSVSRFTPMLFSLRTPLLLRRAPQRLPPVWRATRLFSFLGECFNMIIRQYLSNLQTAALPLFTTALRSLQCARRAAPPR
jgi:hypothetical protein